MTVSVRSELTVTVEHLLPKLLANCSKMEELFACIDRQCEAQSAALRTPTPSVGLPAVCPRLMSCPYRSPAGSVPQC